MYDWETLTKMAARGTLRVGARALGRLARGVGRAPSDGTSFLFVVAHPRSGSTLLAHILTSSPEIAGIGEHHQSYRNRADLDALVMRTSLMMREDVRRRRYVLDKTVWAKHAVGPAVRALPETRFVFIVREPKAALGSMRRMTRSWDGEDVVTHYVACLDRLARKAAAIDDPDRCFFMTFEALLADPDAVLEDLGRFLGLSVPLQSRYEVGATTGNIRYGDDSQKIRAGRIVSPTRHVVDLPPGDLDRARTAHGRAIRKLGELCTTPRVALEPTPTTHVH